MNPIRQYPHCDPRVLHAPEDNCEVCNEHEDWQALRKAWGIAFTGHSFDKQGNPFVDEYGNVILPCPAQYNRGMTSVDSWHGNIALTPEVKEIRQRELDKLDESMKDYYDNLEDPQ